MKYTSDSYSTNDRRKKTKQSTNTLQLCELWHRHANFCAWLHDSLIRDRLVIAISKNTTQKKLLQNWKLTLSRAIDICHTSESTLRKEIKKLHETQTRLAAKYRHRTFHYIILHEVYYEIYNTAGHNHWFSFARKLIYRAKFQSFL